MTVQSLIDQVLDEAMRLGQKPHGAYRSYWDVYNPIITFFRGKGLEDYSPEVIQEYIDWVTEKYRNGQIKRERHSMLTTAARRVAHFERTGTYLWNVPKRGSRYELDAYYAGIVTEFLSGCLLVIGRYPHFRKQGLPCLSKNNATKTFAFSVPRPRFLLTVGPPKYAPSNSMTPCR